eukprot:superscaffoldBa00001612_g11307
MPLNIFYARFEASNSSSSSRLTVPPEKAHQRLYFLRRLRQAGLNTSVLAAFYRCVVESTLTFSITTWYGNCSAADRKALQRVEITRSSLPSIVDIYISRCRSSASRIMGDPTHRAHGVFYPPPLGQEAAEH